MSAAAILWFFCTTALFAATAQTPIAGPWLIQHDDGHLRIQLELSASTSAQQISHIHLRAPQTENHSEENIEVIPATRERLDLQRPFAKNSTLLSLRVPPEQALYRSLTLWINEDLHIPIRLPQRKHADASARVALIDGALWPNAQDMQALAQRLGGDLDAVLLFGRGWESSIGHGGWEADIPIIVAGRNTADIRQDALVGPVGDWRRGVDLGSLALPLIDRPETSAHVLAAFDQHWLLPIDIHAWWSLSRSAEPARYQTEPLALLIDAAHRRHQLPLILGVGSKAGFLSDPLVADDARSLRVDAAGVRYLASGMSGQALAHIPESVALPLDNRAILGIQADPEQLLLCIHLLNPEAENKLNLRWNKLGSQEAASPAWGRGDAEALFSAWKDGATESLEQLAWLPLPELRALGMTSDDLRALMAIESPASRLLLRRMTGADASLINEWVTTLSAEASRIQRDIILRQLHHPERFDRGFFRNLLLQSADTEVILSTLRVAEVRRSLPLLRLMTQRLEQQVAGELALDSDPFVQHALLHALFDSPFLSPTPLRPLALQLRDRVSSLARQPIERFLEQHGEHAPLPD